MSVTTYVIPHSADGPSAAVSRRTDDLDDHFPEPEEDLAHRLPAEFAVPLSARLQTDSGQRLDRPAQVR